MTKLNWPDCAGVSVASVRVDALSVRVLVELVRVEVPGVIVDTA